MKKEIRCPAFFNRLLSRHDAVDCQPRHYFLSAALTIEREQFRGARDWKSVRGFAYSPA